MEKVGGTRISGGARDARGHPLEINRRIVFKRLEKYQWHQPSSVTLFEEELERLKSVMGLPSSCMEQALEILKQARNALDVRMPVEPLAAAALYMACRMLRMPRPIEEFAKFTKTTQKKIAKYYRLLLQTLNVKVPISDPVLYISRIAGQLKLSGEVVKTAVEILQKAKKAGVTSGKDPAGLAAAAVYIAALMHGRSVTQKEVSLVVDVAIPTIRDKIKLLLRIINKPSINFEKEVEVDGRRHVVKVVNGEGRIEENQSGRKLLRIKITAEVDGVKGDYEITFGKYGRDRTTRGICIGNIDDGAVALIMALTGKEPRIRKRSSGKIELVCGRQHLDALARYAELAEVIEKWLGE